MTEYRHLTVEEAIAALPEGDRIHTTTGGSISLGADWDRPEVEEEIRKAAADERLIEVPRETFAWRLGHRIAILRHFASGGSLAIETRDGYGD
jgi:hypothetical protein